MAMPTTQSAIEEQKQALQRAKELREQKKRDEALAKDRATPGSTVITEAQVQEELARRQAENIKKAQEEQLKAAQKEKQENAAALRIAAQQQDADRLTLLANSSDPSDKQEYERLLSERKNRIAEGYSKNPNLDANETMNVNRANAEGAEGVMEPYPVGRQGNTIVPQTENKPVVSEKIIQPNIQEKQKTTDEITPTGEKKEGFVYDQLRGYNREQSKSKNLEKLAEDVTKEYENQELPIGNAFGAREIGNNITNTANRFKQGNILGGLGGILQTVAGITPTVIEAANLVTAAKRGRGDFMKATESFLKRHADEYANELSAYTNQRNRLGSEKLQARGQLSSEEQQRNQSYQNFLEQKALMAQESALKPSEKLKGQLVYGYDQVPGIEITDSDIKTVKEISSGKQDVERGLIELENAIQSKGKGTWAPTIDNATLKRIKTKIELGLKNVYQTGALDKNTTDTMEKLMPDTGIKGILNFFTKKEQYLKFMSELRQSMNATAYDKVSAYGFKPNVEQQEEMSGFASSASGSGVYDEEKARQDIKENYIDKKSTTNVATAKK